MPLPGAGRDLVASALGNTWNALVQVAFVPVYIAMLGLEAYGLIGVHAFLQMSLWVLDMGLTPALSRAVARAGPGTERDELRVLLRSIEVVFAGIAALIVVTTLALAPWVAARWLRADSLPLGSVATALQLMGALVAMRLFTGAYRGAIAGAGQLVWLNAVASAFATLRAVGVIAVLWVMPAIEAFFAFQLLATVAEAVAMRARTWALLPAQLPARFALASLASVRRFSGGVLLVTLLYVALTQSDKVVLSALLPLAAFGHYALASSVATALHLLIAPVGAVAFPRLNELAGKDRSLEEAVHALSQLMALAVAPAGMVLALFPSAILEAWTRDSGLAAAVAPILAPLALGALCTGFMSVPYLLPVVHGRPRELAAAYCLLLAFFAPALYWGALSGGAIGAAWAWLATAVLGVLVAPWLLRQDVGSRGILRWLGRGVAAPAIAAFAATALVRWVVPDGFVLAFVFAAGTALAVTPSARALLAGFTGWRGSRPS